MQGRSPEHEHRGHHRLGAAVGDDGARDRPGDGVVDDLDDARLSHLAEVFPDPVGDHHRLVHRIAEHREHGGEHGQRELPLEQREKTQDDDHVVQVGDDRRDPEFPFEAHREIADDAERGDEQGEGAVLGELAPHLGPDELHPPERRGPVLSGQSFHHGLGEIGAVLAGLQGHANQRVARGAEVLHRVIVITARVERLADLLDFRGVLVAHFHHRAAGELDREIQALGGEEKHREKESEERHHVERQRMAHERDVVADLEEFHLPTSRPCCRSQRARASCACRRRG